MIRGEGRNAFSVFSSLNIKKGENSENNKHEEGKLDEDSSIF